MRRTVLILAAALALAACETTSARRGDPGPSAPVPTTDEAVCRPEALAALADEPLPPEGVSSEAVVRALVAALGEEKGLAFWRWLTVEWPGWAREHWTRLAALHAACEAG